MKTYALAKKCLALVAAGLLLGGCANAHKIDDISVGMDEQQVVDILGKPVKDEWFYKAPPGTLNYVGADCHFVTAFTLGLLSSAACPGKYYWVQFEKGKVSAFDLPE